jgi:hypothetical protein
MLSIITILDVLKSSLYELGFQTDICGSYDSHNIARYVNSYNRIVSQFIQNVCQTLQPRQSWFNLKHNNTIETFYFIKLSITTASYLP